MIRIVDLCDNKSLSPDFAAEHGLSYYIEAYGKKILFDTGQSDVFLRNAKKLNIDLSALDLVVLSHGHYDHVGGLARLTAKNVYCHRQIFVPKYKVEENSYKDIGFPCAEADYRANQGHNFCFFSGTRELAKNIYLISDFQKIFNKIYFFVKKDGKYLFDTFEDETALVIVTSKGLVVITGCAHSGVLNIIEKAQRELKQKKIYALLGGFHLSKADNTELIKTAARLNEQEIKKIGIGHCTGDKFINYLSRGNAFDFKAGQVIEL
jgi:7,8-dihydropterin-6-yl-methyl-4-(beta-D-ribofuranosyl)aminobenzene 5'-phosphate synthase